jgi:hypothetical protein
VALQKEPFWAEYGLLHTKFGNSFRVHARFRIKLFILKRFSALLLKE